MADVATPGRPSTPVRDRIWRQEAVPLTVDRLRSFQAVGGGVSRVHVERQRQHGEMAAGVRRPGAGEHLLHSGLTGEHISHQCVQQSGGQNTGRATGAAG